jgi:molecular chaperone DnaJ
MKDYYDILAISKDASQAEIKKAFRKLAQKYHPDKAHDGDDSSEKFKEINEAYQVLSDEKQRHNYDFQNTAGGQNPFNPFGGFGDLFNDIFGAHQQAQRRQQKQPEAVVNFSIPIDDLRSGPVNLTFKSDNAVSCDVCSGKGGDSRETCNHCAGHGQVIQTFRKGDMTFQSTTPCEICYGSGVIIKNVCRTCLGNGHTNKQEEFDITITCKIK